MKADTILGKGAKEIETIKAFLLFSLLEMDLLRV